MQGHLLWSLKLRYKLVGITIMKAITIMQRYVVLLVGWALLLVGCGDDTSGVSPPSELPVSAYNSLMVAKVAQETVLDLTAYVQGNNPRIIQLETIQQEYCMAELAGPLTIIVTLERAGRCDYTYSVKDARGAESSAELVVVSAETDTPVLPAASVTVMPDSNVLVNLVQLLGSEVIPDGYKLSVINAVHEQGSESLSALVITDGLEFSFTTPSVIGWHYVNYVLTDAVTNDAMIGSVFISIANGIDRSPIVSPLVMEYSQVLVINETVTIDLAGTPGLSITDDSGYWQLQNVKSVGATVKLVAPDDVTNTQFTFMANAAGYYDVAYIVSDRVGGSTMGIMRFNVENVAVSPAKDWGDITHNGKVYTAPLTYSEGKVLGNDQYIVENIAGNNYQVSRWSNVGANNYCEGIGGRLPLNSELQSLYEATGTVALELVKWPKNIAYISKSSDSHYGLYSINNGSNSEYLAGYDAYLTCVDLGLAYLTVEPMYINDGENTTLDSVIAGKSLSIKARLTSRNGDAPIAGVYIASDIESKYNPLSTYFVTHSTNQLTHDARVTSYVSDSECIETCLTTSAFWCKGLSFNESESLCQLFDEISSVNSPTQGEDEQLIWVRNNVRTGMASINCPQPTDIKGETICEYVNTVAGDFSVRFEAEQGLLTDNAMATTSIKVTADMDSLQIIAPGEVFVKLSSEATSVNVSQVDQYMNPVINIEAEVSNSITTDVWWLDSIKPPIVHYPLDSERSLNVRVDRFDYSVDDTITELITRSGLQSDVFESTKLTVGIRACKEGELAANPDTICMPYAETIDGYAITHGLPISTLDSLRMSQFNREWMAREYWFYATPQGGSGENGHYYYAPNVDSMAMFYRKDMPFDSEHYLRAASHDLCDVLTDAVFQGRKWKSGVYLSAENVQETLDNYVNKSFKINSLRMPAAAWLLDNYQSLMIYTKGANWTADIIRDDPDIHQSVRFFTNSSAPTGALYGHEKMSVVLTGLNNPIMYTEAMITYFNRYIAYSLFGCYSTPDDVVSLDG